MDILLNEIEVRVLGCLLEKSMTTPDYYPLSLNALTNACNQKSNRNPVVSYSEEVVTGALDSLKEKRLVAQSDYSRVRKYQEIFVKGKGFITKEAAVIMTLLLRGPQTVGEIRARSERAFKFADIQDVEESLENLTELGYVTKLPRQPGRKEHRYTHLLAGEPVIESMDSVSAEKSETEVKGENEKISVLMAEIDHLRAELETLKNDFLHFKNEFE